MSKVLQVGLFTRSEKDLEAFADRVSEFNRKKGFLAVEMEGRQSDKDELCDTQHWKITLEFRSRAIAKEFWTDPDYQKQVYAPSANDNERKEDNAPKG